MTVSIPFVSMIAPPLRTFAVEATPLARNVEASPLLAVFSVPPLKLITRVPVALVALIWLAVNMPPFRLIVLFPSRWCSSGR